MEKCGLALSPHCNYCTDTMKEIDGNWDIKCLETSCHIILCKCKYYSSQRASYYNDFTTNIDEIFTKHTTHNISKMIRYLNHNIKIFGRPIKLTKNQLSSHKHSYIRKAKRKTPDEDHNITENKNKNRK